MGIVTPAELALLRESPQNTELYLSIFQPTVAMACLVSGTPSKESQQIPYRSVSSGSYLSIESGMTMLVGTTPGGRELGKIRVRSATATHITVSENSSINWPTAVYLTVLRYWEVWPVYPRIISDPNNVENVIFYKDYDIAYTNQNSILGTFQCAGSHLAGWVGDSFYFTNTGTTHLLGSALTHEWAFEGATVTGSTSATPGNITWNTPGHYVVRYKATGANGSVDTTYRYVSIYNRPQNSSQNNPIKKWEFDTVSGGRDEGGYSSSMRVIDEVLSINEGDVVVIFSDNWYGNQNVSLGSNSSNPKIFFTGHILNDTISYDYKKSVTQFDVGSITLLSKAIEGFSVSVESKANPSKWFELLDMDGRRAIYHYLRWHSTLLNIADFQFFGTDQKIQYFDSDRGSVYDAVDNYMRGTLEGKFTSDIQGKTYAEVGAWAYTNPTGSFPTIMSITKRDWVGEPNITERQTPLVSFIERGGVAYSGSTTGTFTAHISQAPGSTPAFRGTEDKAQGLAISGQSHLNRIAGNLLANKNAQFPEITMNMSGNYRNLDIAPQNTVAMDISATDTNRNVEIHAPYIIERITWAYNPKTKILLPEVTYKSLVNGFLGETIRIPNVEDIVQGGGFNVPGLRVPTINPLIPTVSTGLRACGLSLFSIDVSDGSASGTMSAFPVSRAAIDTYSDPTLFSDPIYPTLTNSGLYMIMAYPLINFSVTTAHLVFTPPAAHPSFASIDVIPFVDNSNVVMGTPFVRPIYYSAGETINFHIAYTGSTGGGTGTMFLYLWVVKLT